VNRDATDLRQLQRWFLTTISHPAGAAAEATDLETILLPGPQQSAAERLAVYSNAYFARLVEVLRELFPCTRAAVGDDLFAQLAVGYLHKHPPYSYTLGRLHYKLIDHLDETRPADWGQFIVDLVRLEEAIDRVFDAPGPEQLPSFALPDDADEHLRLRLVPGAELHAFTYPVSSHYTAWKAGQEPPWPEAQAQLVLLLRRDYIVRRYELDETQYELLLNLHRGRTLAEALAAAADTTSTLDNEQLLRHVGDWFRYWSSERFFAAG
jgi:hypothetical protein